MPDKEKTQPIQDNDTISDVVRYLVKRSGKTVQEIAEATHIPLQTLYALHSRKSTHANIRTLKKLADYFNEDLTIFCGLKGYKRPERLTSEQRMVLEDYNTLTHDAQLQLIGYIKLLKAKPENVARLI